jgi:hypothetical protein
MIMYLHYKHIQKPFKELMKLFIYFHALYVTDIDLLKCPKSRKTS